MELVQLPSQLFQWKHFQGGINLDDAKVVVIEKICQMVIGALQRQVLSDSQDDFLQSTCTSCHELYSIFEAYSFKTCDGGIKMSDDIVQLEGSFFSMWYILMDVQVVSR